MAEEWGEGVGVVRGVRLGEMLVLGVEWKEVGGRRAVGVKV